MSDHDKDLQAEELADLARRLEAALKVDAPEARSEKSLFVAGIGAKRRPRRRLGSLAPALAAVVLLVAIGIASRTAQPGQALFGVREALDKVGLAPSTTTEIREHLARAENLVVEAESAAVSAPTSVEEMTRRAFSVLDRADDLVGELDSDRRGPFEREIEALEDRAEAAEDQADETIDAREDAEEEAEEAAEEREDSSGSGSGGDDSSGSGSGGDDSSGSGSGSGSDDDSSGSGSGGDGDSSGSGSGGDDSSGSGSGSGDSSGSGSGGD